MSGFSVGRSLAVLAGLAGLTAAAAETLARAIDAELRVPIYSGGAAGLTLAAVGIPFAVKLARLGAQADSGGHFWKWWGAGLLLRMALLLGLSLGLLSMFPRQAMPALLALIAAYMAGMLSETAMLAKIFFATNIRPKN